MTGTFKSIFLVGVVGCALWFWCAVLFSPSLWMEAIGASLIMLTIFGLSGWIFFKSKQVIRDPRVSSVISATARTSYVAYHSSETQRSAILRNLLRFLAYLQKMTVKIFVYVFSFSGRVKRNEYILVQIGAYSLILIYLVFMWCEPGTRTTAIAGLLAIASIIAALSSGVRRTRDTGINQWWFLLILVPPVNLAVHVFLMLVPTDEFVETRF